VLRPAHQDHPHIYKNICDEQSLLTAFHAAQKLATNGLVFAENDLRAFCNPTRQEIIKKAGQDLIQKLRSSCPSCHAPGYWPTKKMPGLPCSLCQQKTRLPIAEVWTCVACLHESEHDIQAEQLADPSQCDHCNP